MPPQLLFDIAAVDTSRLAYDQEAIRKVNPQRGHMEQLHGIFFVDADQGILLGYKDIAVNEFWAEGHIPGRPLFPGVLMIEAGAQLASFYTRQILGWTGFIGFGGVDEVRFRAQVVPPARMFLLGKKLWVRHRRMNCVVQGVVDGSICFEANITGAQM